MKRTIRELISDAGIESYNTGRGYYMIPIGMIAYRMERFAEFVLDEGFEPAGYNKMYGDISIVCGEGFRVWFEDYEPTDFLEERIYGYSITDICGKISKIINSINSMSTTAEKLLKYHELKLQMLDFCNNKGSDIYLDEGFVKISIKIEKV